MKSPSRPSLHSKILTVIQNLAPDAVSLDGSARSFLVIISPSLPHMLVMIRPILTVLPFVPSLILTVTLEAEFTDEETEVKKVDCQGHIASDG